MGLLLLSLLRKSCGLWSKNDQRVLCKMKSTSLVIGEIWLPMFLENLGLLGANTGNNGVIVWVRQSGYLAEVRNTSGYK
jgi:hypothetical protein